MPSQDSALLVSSKAVWNALSCDTDVWQDNGCNSRDVVSVPATVLSRRPPSAIGFVLVLLALLVQVADAELIQYTSFSADEQQVPQGVVLVDLNGTRVLLDADEQEARRKRLQDGPNKTLYHQTTQKACKSIVAGGFRRGHPGIAGRGIYFAEKPEQTAWKAQHWGCMIEAQVQLGATLKVQYNADPSFTGESLLRRGYDSVWIPRGKPIGSASAPEWVVYFADQIIGMHSYPCHKSGKRRN